VRVGGVELFEWGRRHEPRAGGDGCRARGSLRLSMGPETTEDEVDRLIAELSSIVYRLHAEG